MTSNNDDPQLLVIGAGLARTGTMSLQKALELLYGKPCYHGFELMKHGTSEIAEWNKLCDKVLDNPDVNLTRDDFGSIFDNYSMSTDAPTNGFVFHLMQIYPNSKIILTVRDQQVWLSSFRANSRPKEPFMSYSNWIDCVVERLVLGANFLAVDEKSLKMTLGQDIDLSDDLQVVAGFNAWNEKVKKLVPTDRLLVFDVTQGWDPLCKFLGFPIPDNQPFPHLNHQQDNQEWIGRKQNIRRMVHVAVYSVIVLGGIAAAFGFWLV